MRRERIATAAAPPGDGNRAAQRFTGSLPKGAVSPLTDIQWDVIQKVIHIVASAPLAPKGNLQAGAKMEAEKGSM